MALAWIARNPNTSTVILGASRPEQVTENLKALEVLPRLTDEIMEKIEKILNNKPSPVVSFVPNVLYDNQLSVVVFADELWTAVPRSYG